MSEVNEFLNIVRHQSEFDPNDCKNDEIHVIGVGATGSHIALILCKMGLTNIHLWDFDIVEAHNIPNQAFGLEHIGKPKVEAMAEIIERDTKAKVTIHNEAVDGSEDFEGYVFLLVDKLETRKEIYNGALRKNPNIKAVIETRMGVYEGRCYTFEPINNRHAKQWEKTIFHNIPVQSSACGTVPTLGSTVAVISGQAVTQFMRWVNNPTEVENEIIFGTNPWSMLTNTWN